MRVDMRDWEKLMRAVATSDGSLTWNGRKGSDDVSGTRDFRWAATGSCMTADVVRADVEQAPRSSGSTEQPALTSLPPRTAAGDGCGRLWPARAASHLDGSPAPVAQVSPRLVWVYAQHVFNAPLGRALFEGVWCAQASPPNRPTPPTPHPDTHEARFSPCPITA